jgi:hypothetical protein
VPPSLESVIPEWTSRTAGQVYDAYWLAYAAAEETGRWRWKGRFRALQWVLFGGVDPIGDEHYDNPPDESRVLAVLTTALAAAANRDEAADTASWAFGVEDMLAWLVGGGLSDPGFLVPRRRPDGRIPTEDEFYAEMLAAEPWKTWAPEQRRDARRDADLLALQHRNAAEAVERAAARYGVR